MGHSKDDAVYKIPHKIKMHWQNQLKILVLGQFCMEVRKMTFSSLSSSS